MRYHIIVFLGLVSLGCFKTFGMAEEQSTFEKQKHIQEIIKVREVLDQLMNQLSAVTTDEEYFKIARQIEELAKRYSEFSLDLPFSPSKSRALYKQKKERIEQAKTLQERVRAEKALEELLSHHPEVKRFI